MQQQKLEQQQEVVELELAARLAKIEDESLSVAGSAPSVYSESLSLSFQTYAVADDDLEESTETDRIPGGAPLEADIGGRSSSVK